MKAGSSCCSLPLITPQKRQMQEVIVSLANAKEISLDAAILYEWRHFQVKRRKKTDTEDGHNIFASLPTGFGRSLVKH